MSFEVYGNLIKMIENYRYGKITSVILDEDIFYKELLTNNLVKISSLENGIKCEYYYLSEYNNSLKTILEFRKIMKKIDNDIINVYFISNTIINQQIYKVIVKEYKYLNIMFLPEKIFTFEIPKHVICSKHEIMKHDEIKKMVNDLALVSVINLPKIKVDDPQCIWIGAKVGDIVRISGNTALGFTIKYRYVIGCASKKIKIKKTSDRIQDKKELLSLPDNRPLNIVEKKK